MKHTKSLRRFASKEIDPSTAVGLRPDHPALQGAGRTIFPSSVVASLESPRFLVSGHNNPKLGKEVLKGERKGWPIFHLALEERATCPTTCEVWASCYGNSSPYSRRHTPDQDFIWLLEAEVYTLARQHPDGLLIRLHSLGDFYSPEYVLTWARLLAALPQLAIFGYTARRLDDPDENSRKTAEAIKVLTDGLWSRFAIRTSASDPIARSRSIVVDADPEDPNTIVCPAQTGATEACSSCGLCWAENARDKTIAFLKHGMTTRGHRGRPAAAVASAVGATVEPQRNPEPIIEPICQPATTLARRGPCIGPTVPQIIAAKIEAAAPDLFLAHPEGVLIADIMKAVGSAYNQTTVALTQLHKAGKVAWVRFSPGEKYKCMRPAGSVEPEAGLTDNQAAVLALLWKAAVDGVVAVDRQALRRDSDLEMGSIDLIVSALRKKGFTEWAPPPPHDLKHAYYRLLRPAPAAAPTAEPTSPLPKATPQLPAVLRAPAAQPPKESVLWEKAEPVARTGRGRAIPATDCPAVPAPAPAPPAADQPLRVPVEFDDADIPAWWPPGSLLSLRYGDCRWPLDDQPAGEADQHIFCGERADEGEPYCPAHARKARARSSKEAGQ